MVPLASGGGDEILIVDKKITAERITLYRAMHPLLLAYISLFTYETSLMGCSFLVTPTWFTLLRISIRTIYTLRSRFNL